MAPRGSARSDRVQRCGGPHNLGHLDVYLAPTTIINRHYCRSKSADNLPIICRPTADFAEARRCFYAMRTRPLFADGFPRRLPASVSAHEASEPPVIAPFPRARAAASHRQRGCWTSFDARALLLARRPRSRSLHCAAPPAFRYSRYDAVAGVRPPGAAASALDVGAYSRYELVLSCSVILCVAIRCTDRRCSCRRDLPTSLSSSRPRSRACWCWGVLFGRCGRQEQKPAS